MQMRVMNLRVWARGAKWDFDNADESGESESVNERSKVDFDNADESDES